MCKASANAYCPVGKSIVAGPAVVRAKALRQKLMAA